MAGRRDIKNNTTCLFPQGPPTLWGEILERMCRNPLRKVSGSVVQAVFCPNSGGIIHIDNKVHGSPSCCAAQWLYRGPKKRETEFSLAEGGSVTSNVDD